MKNLILYILCSLFSLSVSAEGDVQALKAKADKAYSFERYEEAIPIYKEIIQDGESADVYYNLGNCYYRLDDIAQSILWYERAYLLNPGDADLRVNLQLARSKTVDKIVPEEELFFVRWYLSLLNMMSVNAWIWTGIIFFVVMLTCLLLYFFGQRMAVRKCGFYCAIVLFAFVVMSNVFAIQQRGRQQNRDGAVVIESSVAVKSTPADAGTDLFLLHSGTSMKIIDQSMQGWYQIRLSDGKEGWISAKAIEFI